MKMKNDAQRLFRRAPMSAVIAAIGLAPVAALALPATFSLNTNGSSSWGGTCGFSCSILELNGSATLSGLNGYFGTSSTPAFTYSAQVDVLDGGPLFGGIGKDSPPAGDWTLSDGSGDTLFGSVTGYFSAPGRGSVTGLYYDVTGGTGVFNDVSGIGGSVVTFSSFPGRYSQKGDFLVGGGGGRGPVHVPEPGTLGLFAAALGALAWSVRRRRRTSIPAV